MFEEFRVGDTGTATRTFTPEDVETFARLTGDFYPLHLDESFAAQTRFGRPVVHGMLTAALLSAANADLLQLPGGISIEQSIRFLRPVFPGDTITATSEVMEILGDSRRLRCRLLCRNQNDEIVLRGLAIEQKDS